MSCCKIKNCGTKKGTCFNVPFDFPLRAKWIHQISKHQEFNYIPASYPICTLHFDQSKIIQREKRTILVKGTLPTIFPNGNGDSSVYPFNESVYMENVRKTAEDQIGSTLAEKKLQEEMPEPIVEVLVQPEMHIKVEIKEEFIDPMGNYSVESPEIKTELTDINTNQKNVFENQIKNKQPNILKDIQRPRPTVTITSDEYNRLLKNEIQLIKYKELCEAKSIQLKRLQAQLAYYKNQNKILRLTHGKLMNNQNKAKKN